MKILKHFFIIYDCSIYEIIKKKGKKKLNNNY